MIMFWVVLAVLVGAGILNLKQDKVGAKLFFLLAALWVLMLVVFGPIPAGMVD